MLYHVAANIYIMQKQTAGGHKCNPTISYALLLQFLFFLIFTQFTLYNRVRL